MPEEETELQIEEIKKRQTPKPFASSSFGLPGKPLLPVWYGRSRDNLRLVRFSRPAIEKKTETSSISRRKSVCLANLTNCRFRGLQCIRHCAQCTRDSTQVSKYYKNISRFTDRSRTPHPAFQRSAWMCIINVIISYT